VVDVVNRPDPEPGAEDVLVATRIAGLNPADVHQRMGRYPAPPGVPADIPGLEVAGEVVACGKDVTRWHVGDRVFGIVAGGGLADRVVVPERCLARIPDSVDEQTAAAVPEAFITAHDAVMTQGAILRGDVLLVHGAGGAVGTAAVQVGVLAGARVFGVARSVEARQRVQELGAEALAEEGFADRVRELTAGTGADVVIELVGAPHFPANVDALASLGRIVVVGVGGGARVELSLLELMQKRATLRGTMLRARSVAEKAAAVEAFGRDVVPALAQGLLRVDIDSVYPAERAADALDRVASQGKTGKVLLSF
jgi:NADPH:quinone reductase-like Zn-dependent oxidoreductase